MVQFFPNKLRFYETLERSNFFEHRLPPRKYILGTKRDKSYTQGGCLSLLPMFSFQSTHTHIWQQKRACHKLNWLSCTQRNIPVGITSIRGGSNLGQPRLISSITPSGSIKEGRCYTIRSTSRRFFPQLAIFEMTSPDDDRTLKPLADWLIPRRGLWAVWTVSLACPWWGLGPSGACVSLPDTV